MSALPHLAWVLALCNFLPLQWQQVPNWASGLLVLLVCFLFPSLVSEMFFKNTILSNVPQLKAFFCCPCFPNPLCRVSIPRPSSFASPLAVSCSEWPVLQTHWTLGGLSSAVFHTWLGCRSSWTCPPDRLLFQDISPRKSFLTPLS